jgi:ribosomal protein L32
MGQPKKRTTPRRTGMRRSHHLLKLARRVNATSPVKVAVNARELKKLRAKS